MQLYEKYRPDSMDAVAGHGKVKRGLRLIGDRSGWGGQVFWFAGPSGTGKTTVARIIAASIADGFSTEELNASELSVGTIRDWVRKCSSRPIGGKCWAFIVNEAHNLSPKCVEELQTILENSQVQRNSTWIFTTTLVGQRELFDNRLSAAAFASRAKCFVFNTDNETEEAIVSRVAEIADKEALNGAPMYEYWKLGRECQYNMRAMLQRVECGEMLAE